MESFSYSEEDYYPPSIDFDHTYTTHSKRSDISFHRDAEDKYWCTGCKLFVGKTTIVDYRFDQASEALNHVKLHQALGHKTAEVQFTLTIDMMSEAFKRMTSWGSVEPTIFPRERKPK